MFAIIESGGRQVRVEEGTIVSVDHINQSVGDEVTFDKVLFLDREGTKIIGNPLVSSANVTGVIDKQDRGQKIRVFRKKRRKGWRRTLGHRVDVTRVRITAITAD